MVKQFQVGHALSTNAESINPLLEHPDTILCTPSPLRHPQHSLAQHPPHALHTIHVEHCCDTRTHARKMRDFSFHTHSVLALRYTRLKLGRMAADEKTFNTPNGSEELRDITFWCTTEARRNRGTSLVGARQKRGMPLH